MALINYVEPISIGEIFSKGLDNTLNSYVSDFKSIIDDFIVDTKKAFDKGKYGCDIIDVDAEEIFEDPSFVNKSFSEENSTSFSSNLDDLVVSEDKKWGRDYLSQAN